ncbi:hypothetical protein [Nostoc sp.]|uniref:hypothetical protein n=1 Tax=Nostoc sp. TaxID=1180 RepID=UPI002FFB39DC
MQAPQCTQATPHCGNFGSSFLITICFCRVITPTLLQKVKTRILPRIAATFSFCIRPGRTFDLATIASCDHFSVLATGAAVS